MGSRGQGAAIKIGVVLKTRVWWTLVADERTGSYVKFPIIE